jgi:mannose/fructose/N-acetylgalactosamine-specific phosphotransferase system component IIB
MPIVLVRVDDRLVHGQILEGWLPCTKAQELLVANDALAQDDLRKAIMQLAIPYTVDLIIDSVERIALLLQETEEREIRQIVIVDNPLDALRLKRAGVRFDRLNLGNLRPNNVTVCLSRSVSVGEDTLEALEHIVREGIQVNIQSVPYEKAVDLFEVFPSIRAS